MLCKHCAFYQDKRCVKTTSPEIIPEKIERCGWFVSIVDCKNCKNWFDSYCVMLDIDPYSSQYVRKDHAKVAETKECNDFEKI